MAGQQPVYIVGAGGMARETCYIIEQLAGLSFEGYLVEEAYQESWGRAITGGRVLGPPSLIRERGGVYYVAIGDAHARERIISELGEERLGPALVAPGVRIHPSTTLEKGVIVCGGVHMTVDVTVGRGAIVNAGCFVGHDTQLGTCVLVSPLASIAGNVRIGRRVDVGTGAAVVQRISIADDVVIGAGAVCVRDITEPGTYVGVPARRLSR